MSQPKPDSKIEELELALEHTRAWFAVHAAQRLQSVNFYLIATAFLTAAFVTAAKDNMHSIASGISVLGFMLSYFFWRMERRIRALIHASEAAIRPLEKLLADSLAIPELEIVKRVEHGSPGEWKYSKVFRYIYLSAGIAYVLGFLFVTWNAYSQSSASAEFRALLKAAVGIILIVVGYEKLTSLPQHVAQDVPRALSRYSLALLGAVAIGSGIATLIHLAFVNLV